MDSPANTTLNEACALPARNSSCNAKSTIPKLKIEKMTIVPLPYICRSARLRMTSGADLDINCTMLTKKNIAPTSNAKSTA
jgi:hypothetical protein